ncbi:SDR family NAD(P)-dependent oxidoreductase [Microvirga sp. W0021]|uniref:SDR family NAD(P)-dependent oxidoreductase n=1 Tax=Hohaiivirga grylli TaxID=3133970 RepID=A0ABV0BG63_9HYPH
MSDRLTPEDGLVWITGASSGIGRALALDFCRRGFTVIATARNESMLSELSASATTSSGRIIPAACDITEAKAINHLIQGIEAQYGPINLAILNAGIYIPVKGSDFKPDIFHKTFSINLGGTVNCLATILPGMKQKGKGHIAITASVTGYAGLPLSSAYGATKAGLINMAESLKFDLDQMGIKIQIINPGFVETPATAGNDFPMPFIITPQKAADYIWHGLHSNGFEITFPKRFTYLLKLLKLLPYCLYFPLIKKKTL